MITRKDRLLKIAELIEHGNKNLLQNRLAEAEQAYRQVTAIASEIPEAHNNLGTVLKEQGLINAAQASFEQALKLEPGYASAHSNLLFTLHYKEGQTLAELRQAHETWAAMHCADLSVPDQLPVQSKVASETITVGLVSPDLYYHPAGVFLYPWLAHSDSRQFRLIVYADNQRKDGMTQRLRRKVALWRDIHGQSDEIVRSQIRADGVDILIDLAGHTAGHRLRLFAGRVAPVQVSWIGYPSTTGVPAMDYILMDSYCAPEGYESFFTEQLIRLEGLRFCYTPPDYAPLVADTPCLAKGYVTFGSFNNLAKLTPAVLQTWVEILRQVPKSRLMLKWKSLSDPQTQERIRVIFVEQGIAAERIECRDWSQHSEMLSEYGEIDIALDPFPFSGGLTSCDALYMGVPIMTVAGELPISRQTASFLHTLDLNGWIAEDRGAYIEKAVAFTQEAQRLNDLRQSLRERMLASHLCDGAAYARSIETALLQMIRERESSKGIVTQENPMKNFLHIGCGPKHKDQTTRGFNTPEWTELCLDIDQSVTPDIVGTMTDMSAVADASVDAIFSSHNIEHLYPHEVPVALAEFKRVLKSGGFAVITCPDLQSVCALVAADKLTDPAYTAPAGPITPLDILYGHRPALARGNLFMAHRCGFTQKVLSGTLHQAGFALVAMKRREHPNYDLWAIATKQPVEEAELRALAWEHFPQ